jgi:nitroimidazol reductase NimA-like FMN-containing flavoprotein (pyridoxamine 5'-phosphate oxidase superfamily)
VVIEEMTERECRAMLAGTNVARLACAHDNQPYIVPIRVDLDGDFLYSYATLGQKIEWMRENPLVCLEIDEVITHGQWTSVVVFGRYEELPHTPEYEGSRRIAESLFQRHPAWWEPASVPLAAHERRTPIVFRIQIGGITGRRAVSGTVTTSHVLGNASEARRPRWLVQVLRCVMGTTSR